MYCSPSASALGQAISLAYHQTYLGQAISLAYHQTYLCWVKVMTDSYPTNQWLSKVGLSSSATCPNCDMQVVETIGHFVTVCPKF